MEQLLGKSKTSKSDLFSDPSHRMPKRPSTVKTGEGLGFQDLGSTFETPNVPKGKSANGKPKRAEDLPLKPRKAPPPITEDESDDELLLFSSQQSQTSHATSSPKRVGKGKKQEISSDKEEMIRVDGRVLKAHPDFKPSSQERVKNIRFTKNKKPAASGDARVDVPPPSSSLSGSQEWSKVDSNEVEIVEDSRQKLAATSSTRRRSPILTRTASRPLLKDDSSSKPSPMANAQAPAKPRPRPRPRPCVVITRKRDSSPDSTPRPAVPQRAFPLANKSPERPTNAQGKRTIQKPPFPSPPRRELQEFPMSLHAKENLSGSARNGDASSGKAKTGGIPRSATVVQIPRPLPLPSPLQSKHLPRGTSFPRLSPLHCLNDKGKARARSSDDEVDVVDDRGKYRPRPFPMSSQMLAGIDRRSKSPSIRSNKSAKRTSSDDSEAEQGRTAKKRRDARPEFLDAFDYSNDFMEDDSVDLGRGRDPSTLCPYCDEVLPSHPTPYLKQLLLTARKKSYSDPRPKNRGGLKAPLTIYISVCQRHRFESHQLPIATERGWPKVIEFAKVPARVKKMKQELEAIILDRDESSDVDDLEIGVARRGARNNSIFWREVKKELKKQGSRTVVGVKGQFASFEKTQPGYYGEQGSVIIHQTLFDLFPPSTFDASLIKPLAPAEFIQRVLVPEAAIRLIAQDLSVGMNDALVTLRDSAQYGVAMFPDTGETKRKGARADDDDDDDDMGVADRIVMERARARRKEIAEEERVELEMMEEERVARRARAQDVRREKALERARLAKARAEGHVGAEGPGEVSDAKETRTAARRGTRQGSVVEDSESDAMSVDGQASRRSTRAVKNVAQVGAAKSVKVTSRPDSSSGDSVEFVDGAATSSKLRERSAERGAHANTEIAAPRELRQPFAGFSALSGDGEHESTPRPAKQRMTERGPSQGSPPGLHGRMLPLQMARDRSGGIALTGCWTRSLRTSVPDETDSDASNASRASQRLDRPPIRKGGSYSWLLSPSSRGDSSS